MKDKACCPSCGNTRLLENWIFPIVLFENKPMCNECGHKYARMFHV